jgi:hypothetical protein
MTILSVFLLKGMRKFYTVFTSASSKKGRNWTMFSNKEYANDLIFRRLIDDKPCMIGRFGSVELGILVNYIGVANKERSLVRYVTGQSPEWWWNKSLLNAFNKNAGFFPVTDQNVRQFSKLILNDIPEVDILGSWLTEERHFSQYLTGAKHVVLEDLEPFFSLNPWTRALKGKKVLVVHPFADTIEQQYKKRCLLFENDLLPEFNLITIKAVQSVAGERTTFVDWFEALESMKNQIDATDYDVCIIGCGAYGFPLAAHVKRMGKKAVHLAGATQLLFGIRGKRWEEFIVWPYLNLFNQHWVRPGVKERPKNAQEVEGACYW